MTHKIELLLLCFFFFLGCNRSEKRIVLYDDMYNLNTHNITKHPYIYEDREIILDNLLYQKVKSDIVTFKVIMSGDINMLKFKHRVFIHGYNGSFNNQVLNVVIKDCKIVEEALVFEKEVTIKSPKLVTKLKVGISNEITSERLFVLSLDNVEIK